MILCFDLFKTYIYRFGTTKEERQGISRLDDIFSRTPDMPKIKIMLNEYG